MKENTQLTNYLDEYLKMDTPQFAVMITGKWGSGKTYYIKKRIEAWSNEKVSSRKEAIVLKPIYISVYGLSTISGEGGNVLFVWGGGGPFMLDMRNYKINRYAEEF